MKVGSLGRKNVLMQPVESLEVLDNNFQGKKPPSTNVNVMDANQLVC